MALRSTKHFRIVATVTLIIPLCLPIGLQSPVASADDNTSDPQFGSGLPTTPSGDDSVTNLNTLVPGGALPNTNPGTAVNLSNPAINPFIPSARSGQGGNSGNNPNFSGGTSNTQPGSSTSNIPSGPPGAPGGAPSVAGGPNAPRGSTSTSTGQQVPSAPSGGLTSDDKTAFNTAFDNSKGSGNASKAKEGDKEDSSPASKDRCKVSTGIDSAYSCNGTQTMDQMGVVANTVSQTLGAQGVQAYGQVQSQNAMQSGSQSAALNAAADTAKIGAYQQMGTAALNLTMGAMELFRAHKHSSAADEMRQSADKKAIKGAMRQGDNTSEGKSENTDGYVQVNPNYTVAQKIVNQDVDQGGHVGGRDANEKYDIVTLNQAEQAALKNQAAASAAPGVGQAEVAKAYTKMYQRETSIKNKTASLQTQVKRTASTAASEQDSMSSEATMAGIQSMVQGVAVGASGALALMEANEMAKQAQLLQSASNTPPPFQVSSGNMNPASDSFNHAATAVNPGTNTDPSLANTGGPVAGGAIPPLGTPPNSDLGPNGPGNTPQPGAFTSGNGDNGAGAPGAGGVGSGATSAAKDDTQDLAPKAAPPGGNTAYNAPGGGYSAGGGAGVGAEKGPDLSFLASLLPKGDEKKDAPNSILEFGGGNRSPASNEPYSLLGRDVNLFKRISDTMAAKNRSGSVGI